MLTRNVTLHTGLKIGEAQARSVTIREETLDDELTTLEAGYGELMAHRFVMMRRVSAIGDLENPAPEILRKLTRTDWELIEQKLQEMDVELATASGLIKPAGDGGRPQPDAETSGDA